MKKIKTRMNYLNFLDFCSGIGGGRIGLENLGMNCLGFSEIDKDAEMNYGDLMESVCLHPNKNNRIAVRG